MRGRPRLRSESQNTGWFWAGGNVEHCTVTTSHHDYSAKFPILQRGNDTRTRTLERNRARNLTVFRWSSGRGTATWREQSDQTARLLTCKISPQRRTNRQVTNLASQHPPIPEQPHITLPRRRLLAGFAWHPQEGFMILFTHPQPSCSRPSFGVVQARALDPTPRSCCRAVVFLRLREDRSCRPAALSLLARDGPGRDSSQHARPPGRPLSLHARPPGRQQALIRGSTRVLARTPGCISATARSRRRGWAGWSWLRRALRRGLTPRWACDQGGGWQDL